MKWRTETMRACLFHTGPQPPINTVASARCQIARRIGELIQQFVRHHPKPFKRLKAHGAPFHRAQAAVLLRLSSAAHGKSRLGDLVASARQLEVAGKHRQVMSRDNSLNAALAHRLR